MLTRNDLMLGFDFILVRFCMTSSTSLSLSSVIMISRDFVIGTPSDGSTFRILVQCLIFEELLSIASKRDPTAFMSSECLSEVSVDLLSGAL